MLTRSLRTLVIAAAALALALGVGMVSAPDAHAYGYINSMQNRNTGRCVDDSTSYGVRAFSCNGLNYQRWFTNQGSFAEFVLTNQATGRCLDDSNYGLRSIGCNGGAFQKWLLQDRGNGVEVRNVWTGKCLDDSGAGLRTFSCNGLNYQRWNFRG